MRTLPLAEPKPSATQSSVPSRSTSARWAPKTHDRSDSSWPYDEAQAGVRADDQLDDGVEQRLRVLRGRQVLLPDLGLGALLEDDQRAPVQRAAGGVGDRGEHDRGLDAHAARHVDERPAGPVRRRCAATNTSSSPGRRGRDAAPPARGGARRPAQRQHDGMGAVLGALAAREPADLIRLAQRSAGRIRGATLRRLTAKREPVDLPQRDRALGRLEQRLHPLGGGRVAVTRNGGRERVEREVPEVGELPARAALESRQVELRRPTGGAVAALRQPGRLSHGQRQPMEPSIWSSMRRFISTAYSIGSSLTIGSMKPLTISLPASSSGMPRRHQVEELLLADLRDGGLVADVDVVLADADRRVGVRARVLVEQQRVADDLRAASRARPWRPRAGRGSEERPPSLEIDLAKMFEVVLRRRVDDLAAGVLVLAVAGEGDREDLAVGPLAHQVDATGTSWSASSRGCSRPTRPSRRSRRGRAW